MPTWDRQPASSLARHRDEALREQLRDVVAPFVPFWRQRMTDLGVAPSAIDGAAALSRLPAVGERDVCPDGDPAGMASLVVQASERGFALHAQGPQLRRALAMRVAQPSSYRRMVEGDTRPTSYVWSGLGMRFPLASTRADLDLVARAGARLWQVLGLTEADVLVSAVPVGRTTEHVALELAALASGAPALFPGAEPAQVEAAMRLVTASVLAAPSEAAADLVDDLATAGIPLGGLRTLLLVGAPTDGERRAALGALEAAGAGDAVLLAVHAPSGARVLWAECRAAGERGVAAGLHTYPDLEIVEVVDAETGEAHVDGPGEVTLTQLGFRGSALLRWRTGDVVTAGVDQGACPACGRTVPRVPVPVRRGGLVARIGAAGVAVDLRAVAGALVGRADLDDWRVLLGRRRRDGREQLLVHLLASADEGEAAVGVAADVRSVSGVLPTQVVASDAVSLAALDLGGRALTRRIRDCR